MGCKAHVDKRTVTLTLELDDATVHALKHLGTRKPDGEHLHIHFESQGDGRTVSTTAISDLLDELTDAVWPD